ncbi:MAG: type III secretion system chaperone [Pseudomonadota bacterium]
MHFNDLIANLGAHLRLPDFVPSRDGTCAVKLDALVYSFYPDEADGSFIVRSMLGRIDVGDEGALRAVLAGNLHREGVAGSALGVDADGAVFLTQAVACAELAFPAFVQSFARFVGMAEHWADHLKTAHAEGALS